MNPGPSDDVPLIQLLEQAESSPAFEDPNLVLSSSPDSASSIPILCSKLAARLRSIDGPVSLHHTADPVNLHLAADSQLGETGKTSRPLNTGKQPVVLARRLGSGRGRSNFVSK